MTKGVATAIELFPALKDKCAVRLIGRLNNVKEQSRVQQEKQGFINEVVSFFTGETRRRQDYINKQLVDVVEDTLDQLTDVMGSVALNSRVLCMVLDELKNLQSHTEAIANEVIDLRSKFAELEDTLNLRYSLLKDAVEEMDSRMKAHQQLDMVIHRWKSNALNTLPCSLRGYSVLDQLWWGDLGFYIQQYPGGEADKLIQYLHDQVVACFANDLQVEARTRISRDVWMEEPSGSVMAMPSVIQSINLLSDWAVEDSAPFVTLMCGQFTDSQQILTVPHLMSAERLGRALVGEFFVTRVTA
ncbi:YjcZ-like family protein [Amphritea sp. 2_MG-2023]|uniref:YjcZ-like family protein n=1 Tax=Amphritea TaxID=515417 RepID=UPI001C06C35C|nr:MULTISPECIES: YjcZ-like family protein [Amphritea]MBU2964028.1 YjcZ-like family protein [Amphritea atlantica]MDO6418428.1 YjcZ-like family protein [Amphritea sp. 2_MG-2023]